MLAQIRKKLQRLMQGSLVVSLLVTAGCQGPNDGGQGTPSNPNPGESPTPQLGDGPFTGNGTHFDALGTPSGACGVPQGNLETQNFVALNVQNTPNNYTINLARPLTGPNSVLLGAYNNGLNCGRWVQVTIDDFCTGVNDGAPGAGFCHSAKGTPWVADGFNGATLNMIVADSCQDNNSWCRDDPYHLDLATAALGAFTKSAEAVGNLLPNNWGNRRLTWKFIAAPNYQGDIQIGFYRGAQPLWTPVLINHLANGIHGVEALVGGRWQKATMNGDSGQVYILPQNATKPYQIRVYDANDQLIHNGRVYQFSFPGSCGGTCTAVYTPVSYTTR